MEILEALKQYQANMDEIRKLDDSINDTSNKEIWQENMLNRANRLSSLFAANNDIITFVKGYVKNPDDKIEQAIHECILMYYKDFDDPEILVPVFEKGIELYKNNPDKLSELIVLYSAMAYESTEYIYRVKGSQKEFSNYHELIYSFKDKYKDFKDTRLKRLFILNYYNHLNAICDKKEYVDYSYQIFKSLNDFLYVDGNEKYFKDDEEQQELIYVALTTWMVADDVIEYASENTKKHFYEAAKRFYEIEILNANDNILDVDPQIYIALLHCKAMFNELSYDEVIDLLMDYYLKKLDSMTLDESISDDDFYVVINTPISIEKLLKHINGKKAKTIMKELNKISITIWDKILKAKKETPFVNAVLSNWCSVNLKYLNNRKEKEKEILRLIVKRQLPTYIHSYMVMNIATTLFKHFYISNPTLFDSINMIYDDLLDYVKKAALLHDIGKTRICDTVNMVRRKLADYEYEGIKMHPIYGEELIANDKDLAIYCDVILGHHKYYNGKSGYPSSFDNTKSRYKIFIDIITLADCLDAATDNLGRNYKSSKTIYDVLEEFKKESNTRYNGELVKMLEDNAKLLKELEKITCKNRLDFMYKACLEFNN